MICESASSGAYCRADQYRLRILNAPSDQGGIEMLEYTVGNQTFDAPRWSVRGVSTHGSVAAPSQGRLPEHLYPIALRAFLPNAPSRLFDNPHVQLMTLSPRE